MIISIFLSMLDDFGGSSEYDRLNKQIGNNIQQINNNGKDCKFVYYTKE